MPGPLHGADGVGLLPVPLPRSGDSHKWMKARYKAERSELVARCAEWEIIGEPELRRAQSGSFNPWALN
jgi:hypothetical protein